MISPESLLSLSSVLFNDNVHDQFDKDLPSRAALHTGHVEYPLLTSADGKSGPHSNTLLSVALHLKLGPLVLQAPGPAHQTLAVISRSSQEVSPDLESSSFQISTCIECFTSRRVLVLCWYWSQTRLSSHIQTTQSSLGASSSWAFASTNRDETKSSLFELDWLEEMP